MFCQSSHLEARGHWPGFRRRMSSWWIWDFSMRQRRCRNDLRVGSDCLRTSLMPSSSWSFADWYSAGNIAPFNFSDHGCYMCSFLLLSLVNVVSQIKQANMLFMCSSRLYSGNIILIIKIILRWILLIQISPNLLRWHRLVHYARAENF